MPQAWQIVREMGPTWVAYRAAYALQRRGGWLRRRTPIREWTAYALADIAGATAAAVRAQLWESPLRPSRTDAARALACAGPDARTVVDDVDQLLQGRFRFFGSEVRSVGFPPAWHRHPDTSEEWPRTHWTAIDDGTESDVKWLWELGRFGVSYDLVRAYSLTGEDRYAETFWRLVESWRDANPPNTGVHWMCGQECAFRSMAWTFAALALIDAAATTDRRVAMLAEMLAAHGDRIAANLGYARSQKNNHAINEALALWAIGTVFPMLRSADRWEAMGRTILEEECGRQIYADGAYVQQSFAYHRLILESYGWALAWGRRTGRPFSDTLVRRYNLAADFLYRLVDESTGRMPNYGSNDGSRLLKLDSCEPFDVRASLALALRAAARAPGFPAGPWDEPGCWLAGDSTADPGAMAPARGELAAEQGGYYTLRGEQTWGFLRCCTYRDRPAQADMLHVDLWWRGHNIVADPGTYSYSKAAPWRNALSSTRVHNTPSVDGLDQMERRSRFVWVHWNQGRVLRKTQDQSRPIQMLQAEHDGFVKRAGVGHRRTITLAGERVWIIVDDLSGSGVHQISSQWLLVGSSIERQEASALAVAHAAGRFAVRFAAFGSGTADESSVEVVHATEESPLGWFSPTYQHKQPALAILSTASVELPARLVTAVALGDGSTIHDIDRDAVHVTLDGVRSSVRWNEAGDTGR